MTYEPGLTRRPFVQAGGGIGTHIVTALTATKKFNITAITRPDSTSPIPAGLAVAKVNYDSHAEVVAALKGQDVLIITLAMHVPQDQQHKLIEAAAAAGVSYVLPNEFGSDNSNPNMHAPVMLFGGKNQYLEKTEQLGKSAWIGFVTNPWYDWCFTRGLFGIDVKNRVAKFYDDGNTRTNTSTMAQVGRGVTALLSLPLKTTDGSPSLEGYRNRYVYVSSFLTTQNEMLSEVQRVTGTKPADWQVSYTPTEQVKEEGKNKWLKEGDFSGMIGYMFGTYFSKDLGGNFEHKKNNAALGLPQEDFEQATRLAVDVALAE